MRRPRPHRLALPAACGAALLAAAGCTSGGPGASSTRTPTAPTTPTAPGTTPAPPAPAPGVPAMPAWAPVAQGPAPFVRPAGGAARVTRVPGGRRVAIERRDGTPLAVAELDRGVYRSVRYFDRRGRLRLVVDRLDAAPPAAGAARATAAGAAGCRDARNPSGAPWGRFPLRWRLNVRSIPRGLSRARVVREAGAARAAWAANRNRCGVPDASRAAFAYRGPTRVPVGLNGVSSVGFGSVDAMGGVCVGALACTFTWVRGGRGAETDTRLAARPRRPYTLSAAPGGTDVRAVIVHETGHALGFGHVGDASNVMFPSLVPGPSHRRLGLGDARANNRRY